MHPTPADRQRSGVLPRVDHAGWLASLDDDAFDFQAAAAERLLSIHQALADEGLSILHELLRDHGVRPIEIWTHYPADDCLDASSGAMFYYHAHDPAEWKSDEHGHFHLFIRPSAEASFSHLAAISMTAQGLPKTLFATNRWVTDETMRPAAELLEPAALRWEIARARPSWMLSQWLTALVSLLQPHLGTLLQARDRIAGISEPATAVTVQPEDRSVHILCELGFDLPQLLAGVQHELQSRTAWEESPATTGTQPDAPTGMRL